MNTTCLCDATTPVAFAVAEKKSGVSVNQIVLSKDALWRSADKYSDVALQVVEGIVWVTFEGDPHDHVLREGQGFRSTGGNRIVMQSLCDRSRVMVQQ